MENQKRPPRSRALLTYEFQRAYRACLPCRERKVKCQMKDDDGPAPCARCSKQGLDCVFSKKLPWSREKKASQGRRVGKRKSASAEEGGYDLGQIDTGSDGTSSSRRQDPRSTAEQQQGFLFDDDASGSASVNDIDGTEGLHNSVLHTMVSSENDALNILFEAAARSDPVDAYTSASRTSINGFTNTQESPQSVESAPQLVNINSANFDVLHIWNACRFVKMGWFTAREAMTLVDLFFINMSHLSPILTDFYKTHSNQYWLVTQEPLLCCTILAISSRYHVLPGPGGRTRSLFIHQRLWQHCQHLLLRLMLGQEKISKAKTRNVGTVEALLLLVEWYPLSVHFPPDNDGWDSDVLLTMRDARDPPLVAEIPASERWKRDIIEPTKRSEQMSWMVLSSALALSHELGIFDDKSNSRRQYLSSSRIFIADGSQSDAKAYTEHLKIRQRRLPKLLFCFINLMSSRLGCASFMSPSPGGTPFESDEALGGSHDPEWQLFMDRWTKLTKLIKSATDTLFPLMTSENEEEFQNCLKEKQDMLSRWYIAAFSGGSTVYEDALFIEYHHLRVLINSTGMQRIITNRSQSQKPDFHQAFQLEHRYGFVEDVIDGCCHILERIIHNRVPTDTTTAGKTTSTLRFAPFRLFSRMISASIFLLKALALGASKVKLIESLHVLDRAILALRSSNLDEVHLAEQYAELLRIQVSALRRSFESSALFLSSRKPTRSSKGHCSDDLAREPAGQFLASHQQQQNMHSHASSSFCEEGNILPADFHNQHQPDSAGTDSVELNHTTLGTETTTTATASTVWDNNLDEWFSLPFDPSMAPFTGWDEQSQSCLSPLNPSWLDVDFIWNLPS